MIDASAAALVTASRDASVNASTLSGDRERLLQWGPRGQTVVVAKLDDERMLLCGSLASMLKCCTCAQEMAMKVVSVKRSGMKKVI
jgi:hypothetical protein